MADVFLSHARDPIGRLIAKCSATTFGSHLDASGRPILSFRSEHPTIRTPLTVERFDTHQLFWHGGYFFDFIGDDPAEEAAGFLVRFFAEEVRCGVGWKDGRPAGGGPVEGDEFPSWPGPYDRIEVRSWRGNRDETREFR